MKPNQVGPLVGLAGGIDRPSGGFDRNGDGPTILFELRSNSSLQRQVEQYLNFGQCGFSSGQELVGVHASKGQKEEG